LQVIGYRPNELMQASACTATSSKNKHKCIKLGFTSQRLSKKRKAQRAERKASTRPLQKKGLLRFARNDNDLGFSMDHSRSSPRTLGSFLIKANSLPKG
jgi:hypothetical protein